MAKFKKGQSGNPGGRPKDEFKLGQLARAHTAEAIQTLVTIMQAKKAPAAARVTAACALLDRGYGRPVQMTELTGRDGAPLQIENVDEVEIGRRVAYLLMTGDNAARRQELH